MVYIAPLVHGVAVLRSLYRRIRGRHRSEVVVLDPETQIDMHGLPGDAPVDLVRFSRTLSEILAKHGITWCVVGELATSYYGAPVVICTYEFCVPESDLPRVADLLTREYADWCVPFRPAVRLPHLRPHPRFKLIGFNHFFHIVPDTLYCLDPLDASRILTTGDSYGNYRVPDLPYLINGMLHRSELSQGVSSLDPPEGAIPTPFFNWVHLEQLVHGMDLDEEWCNTYINPQRTKLPGLLKLVEHRSPSPYDHPKYQGRITDYIATEEQRQERLNLLGRYPLSTPPP
ncbi:hypothetical protein BXZ70DRAFT_931810 [Cristinia sonorae]|uniref:Uncharacterized protein n=1 Tax=Cristinia sonorae TaxID=1940300 RepID=A0A8K0URI3_9AGAR|nr:hypothetical protein BXZ70DRAFT_931810 [Cristinia sonorae]